MKIVICAVFFLPLEYSGGFMICGTVHRRELNCSGPNSWSLRWLSGNLPDRIRTERVKQNRGVKKRRPLNLYRYSVMLAKRGDRYHERRLGKTRRAIRAATAGNDPGRKEVWAGARLQRERLVKLFLVLAGIYYFLKIISAFKWKDADGEQSWFYT